MSKLMTARIRLNDTETFMSDDVTSILYDHLNGEDFLQIFTTKGTTKKFYLDDILSFQFYPTERSVDN